MRFLPIRFQIFLGCILNFAVAIAVLRAQSERRLGAALEAPVRIPAARFEHVSPGPLSLDPRTGIGPDEAATITLLTAMGIWNSYTLLAAGAAVRRERCYAWIAERVRAPSSADQAEPTTRGRPLLAVRSV